MALVEGQIIPPSLANAFGVLIGNTGGNAVGLLPSATTPYPDTPRRILALDATAAANWLADAWQGPEQSYLRSAFYADRYDEIRSGIFLPEFWRPATQVSDNTLKSVPISSLPWTGAWNPTYYDPLRKATICIYKTTTLGYATPPDAGTELNPAPGWRGQVSNSYFRDVWHSQQSISFTLHYRDSQEGTRPLFIHTHTHINASSTIRGNKTWFKIAIAGHWYSIYETPWEIAAPTQDHWNENLQIPIVIPEPNPAGWSHTVDVTRIQNGRHTLLIQRPGRYTKFQVIIATPPSKGLYYSRNDAVRITHHSTCNVYQARTPND